MQKILTIFLFIFILFDAIHDRAQASELKKENVIRELLNLKSKADAAIEINRSYVKTVNECLQSTAITQYDFNKDNLDVICNTHLKFLLKDLRREFKDLRFYLVLSNLALVGTRESSGKNFFEVSQLIRMFPTLRHSSLAGLSWISNIELPELNPLSATEKLRILETLKFHIKSACEEFITNDSAAAFFTSIVNPEFGSNPAKYFCYIYLNFPESQDFVLSHLNPEHRTMWTSARDKLTEIILFQKFQQLKEKAKVVYDKILGRYPFLVLVKGDDSYISDLQNAFNKIAMINDELKSQEEALSVSKLQENLNSGKLSEREKLVLLNTLTPLLDFDNLVESQLMEYSFSETTINGNFLRSLREERASYLKRRSVTLFGIQLAATASCFIPLGRMLGLASKIAGTSTLSFKNVCLFALTQPLNLAISVHEVQSAERVYNLFLAGSEDDSLSVEYTKVDESVKSAIFSLFFIPLGSSQTFSVLKEIRGLSPQIIKQIENILKIPHKL